MSFRLGVFCSALLALLLLVPREAAAQVYAVNSGDIVCANYRAGGNTVIRIDPMTGAVRRVGVFNYPTDVALSSDGLLYVSELGGTIKRVDLANGSETIVNTNTTILQIWGMALGPDDNLYVTTSMNDRIVRVNRTTGEEAEVAQGGQMSVPTGIDFLDPNHLVVASRNNNRVVSVSLLDKSQTVLARGTDGIDQPWGIAVHNGDIYVGGHDSKLLFRITGTTVTNILPTWSPNLGNSPFGIGVTSEGNILIGTSGGIAGPYALEGRDPQGTPLPSVSGNLIGEITGVEVSPVSVVAASQINTPPQLAAIPESAPDEGVTLALAASGTDTDWPLQELTFSLTGDVPAGVTLSSDGVFIWKPTEAQGPSTNQLSLVVTDDGIPSLSATQTFTVIVHEVNTAPVVTPVDNKLTAVGAPLSFKVTATDADLPKQVLSFSLEPGAPLGANITAGGDFIWTPGAVPGPGSYQIGVTATDNGPGLMSHTAYFTVSVREANVAPVIPAITNRTVDEGTVLSFQVAATDANLPSQTLTYGFAVDPPAGAAISPSGSFTWTPIETQGPGTNVISVRVADDGLPPLSATNSFTVVINEVNRAPAVDPITSQIAYPDTLLSFQITATDPDRPAQQLAFSLGAGAPVGASLTSGGDFSWRPDTTEPAGTHTLSVTVTDDGIPPLTGSRSFTIDVRGGFTVNGGDIIVANYDANAVVKIDGQTGAAQSLGTFPSPTDVALTGDTLYVAEQGGAIERLNLRTGAISLVNTNSGLYDIRSMALGPAGELYVTTAWDDSVVRVDPNSGAETPVTQGGLISGPMGIALLDSQHLVVSSQYANRLVAVALANNAQSLIAEGNGISQPCGVTVANNGSILVVSQGAQAVQTVSGGSVSNLVTVAGSPYGIGVGSSGDLVVSSLGTVSHFSSTGTFLTSHQTGLAGNCMGVEVVAASVNNPPVPGTHAIQRLANTGAKLLQSQVLGSDPDGDPVALQSVSASSAHGGAVATNQFWILYAPPLGFSSSDSFTYTVSDPWGATAVGTIQVNVVADEAVSSNLVTQDLGNGSFRLRFSGIPDAAYVIQYSTNLQTPVWQTLHSTVADSFGQFEFVDTPPTGQSRIYRSTLP